MQQARTSNSPAASNEDLMAVRERLDEEVLRCRKGRIAAAQEDFKDIEPRALSSARSRAEWVEEWQTVGSPVSGGTFETTSFKREPMFRWTGHSSRPAAAAWQVPHLVP